jgi:membrane protein implicated in regulation of membrane protease activity
LTVIVGLAMSGSEIVVPGMMKLIFGRPSVFANAARRMRLSVRL